MFDTDGRPTACSARSTFNDNGDPEEAAGAVVGFTIYEATDKLDDRDGRLAEAGDGARRPAASRQLGRTAPPSSGGRLCPPARVLL